jgi:hypothetical protein
LKFDGKKATVQLDYQKITPKLPPENFKKLQLENKPCQLSRTQLRDTKTRL